MKLEYKLKQKKSSKLKTLVFVVLIVACVAAFTFAGAFVDYLLKINIITYVMFAACFIIAYAIFKKLIFEYRYVYADDIFSVEKMINDNKKYVFICDKKYFADVVSYQQLKERYPNVRAKNLSFLKKEELSALVYKNDEGALKAILFKADAAFVDALKAEISEISE